jgi:hypothetical protein
MDSSRTSDLDAIQERTTSSFTNTHITTLRMPDPFQSSQSSSSSSQDSSKSLNAGGNWISKDTYPGSSTDTSVEDDDPREHKEEASAYVEGYQLTISPHDPPEPFDDMYQTAEDQNLEGMGNSLGEPRSGVPSQTMTITSIIRTGDESGPQIVVLNQTHVAKIYDWQCYRHRDEDGFVREVRRDAIGSWSREVAAYKLMPTAVKDLVPRYDNSYSTKVTSMKDGERTVPLILIETVQGTCMRDLNPLILLKRARSDILKKVLAAEARLYSAGVDYNDLHPRNVMVQHDSSIYKKTPQGSIEKPVPVSVKIVDFANASLVRHPKYTDKELWDQIFLADNMDTKLANPFVLRYGKMSVFAEEGWCLDKEDEADKWLWRHFGEKKEYKSVHWDKSDPDAQPRHKEDVEKEGQIKEGEVARDLEISDAQAECIKHIE